MKLKYNQKEKTLVSEELRNAIKTMDDSDKPEFDIIRNTGSYFNRDKDKTEHLKIVKKIINYLIA